MLVEDIVVRVEVSLAEEEVSGTLSHQWVLVLFFL